MHFKLNTIETLPDFDRSDIKADDASLREITKDCSKK